MKLSFQSIRSKQNFVYETNGEDRRICSAHTDHVNFPSTAEVFHAVFDNKFFANCIGNCKGKTLKANPPACKLFGYTKDEMIRLSTKELFETSQNNYLAFIHQRDSHGKAKAIVTGIRKNGVRFLCEISSFIFTDENGEKRTINTMHDVSKKYESLGMFNN